MVIERIKQNRRLFRLADEFNRLPSRYAHPSWIEGWMPESVYSVLRGHRRAEQRLSSMILHRFELQGRFVRDFDDPLRRMALLPAPVLMRLAMLAGICLHAGTIARSVHREFVHRIKNEIGEEGYRFALRKAPFLIGRMRFSTQDGQAGEKFNEKIFTSGIKCVRIAFGGQPEELIKRLMLKLPWRATPDIEMSLDSREHEWAKALLKKIYNHELGAECRIYFT